MFIFSLNNFSEIEAKNKQALKPFRPCCWRAFCSGTARNWWTSQTIHLLPLLQACGA
ncbi:hypothetical protein CTX91_004644 [Salmonella enterica subsp. diarizonae]|nr:hypothetical protein [Salmonella enterica subsp. diarizonae]EDU4493054.1 hypothetical protein [Salmonella enterica subsp. diarizonae]EDV3639929.1 hypothetical protein [Salmonella enterica subsp. diarizonae]HAF2116973.1 hypothetical protein [Salmonella enterica]